MGLGVAKRDLWVSGSAPHLLHKGLPDRPHYVDMSFQGVMSSTEANNNHELYPVKDSSLVLAVRLGPRDKFSSLSLEFI